MWLAAQVCENISEATTSKEENETIFDPKKEKWTVQRDAYAMFQHIVFSSKPNNRPSYPSSKQIHCNNLNPINILIDFCSSYKLKKNSTLRTCS